MNTRIRTALGFGVALALAAGSASATNGYYTHGAGTKSKGQAGAGSANPEELMIFATNPAGLTALPESIDAGLGIFSPMRDYRTTSSLANGGCMPPGGPANCAFTLPARVRQGPLLVTFSTGGHSPALATWLRRRFSDEIGPEYLALMGLLADERSRLQREGVPTEGLDWQGALDSGMLDLVREGRLAGLPQLLETLGQPVLVFYAYQHDRARIKARLPIARELKRAADIEAWNLKRVPVMLAHPASAGHGLNLQDGGSIIVWFGLPWSLELYQQANARLHRQGQTQSVIVHHLVARGTIDERVLQVLGNKAAGQADLLEAVRAVIEEVDGDEAGFTRGGLAEPRGLDLARPAEKAV